MQMPRSKHKRFRVETAVSSRGFSLKNCCTFAGILQIVDISWCHQLIYLQHFVYLRRVVKCLLPIILNATLFSSQLQFYKMTKWTLIACFQGNICTRIKTWLHVIYIKRRALLLIYYIIIYHLVQIKQ